MIGPNESPAAWRHCLAVIRPALLLAPRAYLQDVHDRLAAVGIQAAVARRDTAVIFDWIVGLLDRQGYPMRLPSVSPRDTAVLAGMMSTLRSLARRLVQSFGATGTSTIAVIGKVRGLARVPIC